MKLSPRKSLSLSTRSRLQVILAGVLLLSAGAGISIAFSVFSAEGSVIVDSLVASSPHSACEADTLQGSFTPSGATDLTVEVSLGVGSQYVAGSAVFSGGSTLVSEDLADLENPVFTITDPTGLVDFYLLRETGCLSYDHQVSGGLLVDTLRIYESGIQISSNELSNQYALDYGVLSLGPATTTPSSALIGETVSRSMTITNGNFGAIDTFWFAEIFGAGDLSAASFVIDPDGIAYAVPAGHVTTAASSDSVFLWFGPDEIKQFGDGDSLFENGETFTLAYDVTLSGCGNGTSIPSDPTVWWGCGGTACQQYQQTAGVSLTQAEPDLSYSIEVRESGCLGYGADPDTIVVMISNSGAGPATDIEFGFQTQHPGVGGFDANSVTWSLDGGVDQSVTLTDLTDPVTDVFNCAVDWPGPGVLYSNGKVFLDAALGSGKDMEVKFLSYKCCPSTCLNPDNLPDNSTYYGTSYRVDSYFKFKNQCGLNEQDLGPGSLTSKTMSMAYTIFSPPNLFDGAASTYAYLDFTELLVSDIFQNLGDVEFELFVDFPRCVDLGGDASTLEWADKDGVSLFSPSSAVKTDSTITVTWDPSTMGASGTSLNLSGTQIRFPVTSDCSEGNCEFTGIEVYFTVKPGTSCGSSCDLKWICETLPVDILCPSVCPNGGGQLLSAIFERENLGSPDGDNNGCPDDDNNCDGTGSTSSTSFNEGLVRKERALAGDTIISQVSGIIMSGAISTNWQYLFFDNELNDANLVDIIGGEFRFVDVSDGNTMYSTTSIAPYKTGDTVRVDLSIPTLGSAMGLPGGVTHYEDGDTVEVTIRYRLNDNLTSTTENITTSNSLFAATNANPSYSERYSCATTRGILIAGKPGTSTYKSWITFPTGCTIKNIGFNTEVDLDGAAVGNNFFPFEYRIWAQPQKYIVTIPQGYSFDRVRLVHKRTTGNGTSSPNYYTGSIVATDSTFHTDGAMTYTFDIHDPVNSSIWAINGGNYYYGDDGSFFRYFAEVSPGCGSPASWKSDDEGGDSYLQKHEYIDVLGETKYRTGSTNLFFTKPSLTSSSPVPTQEGVTSEVEWEVSVSNLSSNIPVENSWVALHSPSGDIGVDMLELYDENDVLLTDSGNGIYHLGTISKNTTETFTVKANYSSCEIDSLLFLVGWDCDGYPASVDDYSCDPDTVVLYVEPLEGQISVVVTNLAATPTDPSDGGSAVYASDSILLCENFPVEFKVNSALPGALDNVFAIMDVPVSAGQGGLEYVAGSGYFEYPIGSTPQPFSASAEASLLGQNGGSQLLFDWSEIGGASLPDDYELPGVYEPTEDRSVIIRMNLRPTCELPVGDKFNIRSFATYGCGAPATGFGENLSGNDLDVSGVSPDYQTIVSVGAIDTFSNFTTEQLVRVTLNKIGTNPVGTGDSIMIRLPKGLTYCGWDACISGTCPDTSARMSYLLDGQEFHVWPLPAMNDGDQAEFDIRLRLDENVYGELGLVEVQTRNQQFMSCSSEPSGLCPTAGTVLSGSGSRAISAYLPSLVVDISNLTANQFDDSVFNFTATISLLTAEENSTEGFWAELYCADDNNDLSNGNPPLDSIFFPGPIAAGSYLDTTITFQGVCNPLDQRMMVIIPDTTYGGGTRQGFNPILNGLSRYGIGPGNNPYDITSVGMVTFPLEWIAVDAIQKGNGALVRWEVAQDMILDHYEIDRMVPGSTFERINKQKVSDELIATYEVRDRNLPIADRILYRIRAIDPNGEVLISPTVELRTEEVDFGISLIQNPVQEMFRLELQVPEEGARINVWNLQGQLLHSETVSFQQSTLEIPVSHLTNGIYLINMSTNKGNQSLKAEIRR